MIKEMRSTDAFSLIESSIYEGGAIRQTCTRLEESQQFVMNKLEKYFH